MFTILSPLKQSLIVLGTIIMVAGITFGALMISRNTSQNYLLSQPHINMSLDRDNELKAADRTTGTDVVGILDGIIQRVRDKVNSYSSSSIPSANAFIDKYLKRISDLEDSIINDPQYNNTYSYLFTYVYPRVYEMKKNILIIQKDGTGSGTIISSSPIGTMTY